MFLAGHYDKNFTGEEEKFFKSIEELKKFKIIDTEYLINKNIKKNKNILAEGAQGTLLDIDFGSYPFVTSSNTTTAGACIGLGISPKRIGKFLEFLKPTVPELEPDLFQLNYLIMLEKKWHQVEMNLVQRPVGLRRCGWLDLPALKYSIMLNGVTSYI